MSSFDDRSRSALLVIDVQNGVVAHAHDRDPVVARIAGLVDRAREAETPVVWVQHSSEALERGTEAWQLVPELEPSETEAVVHKRYGDAFEDTDLERVLAEAGAGRLVVTGAQTDECVRSTIHSAFTRGYDVTLVGDAHTTEDLSEYGAPPPRDVIAHTNLYWRYMAAPGRTAAVQAADEVSL